MTTGEERDARDAEDVAPARDTRVLVVDDEDGVRDLVATALAEQGFDVRTAAAGDEAWELLRSGERFDVLVTDVVMPGMNGLDLARRAVEADDSIDVLLMSGYASGLLDDLEPEFELLAKPFTPTSLVARVERIRTKR